jgi:hypothetical protein
MSQVERSIRLAAPAAEVWALIGPFDAMPRWHPAMLSCRLAEEDEATLRHLTVVGRIQLVERLVSLDDAARTCRYTLIDGPLPVEGYRAMLHVADNGDASATVVWSSIFEPAGAPEDVAVEAIVGIYDSGLNSLAERFGQAA